MAQIARRFSSIKRHFKSPGISMKWNEGAGDEGWVKKSEDDPHPATEEFNAAFDALAPFIITPLGLSEAQSHGLVVLGANFFFTKDGELTACISAARPIEGFNTPLNINLPKQAPTGDLKKLLEDLEYEAGEYLDGKKGQLELPLEDPEDED